MPGVTSNQKVERSETQFIPTENIGGEAQRGGSKKRPKPTLLPRPGAEAGPLKKKQQSPRSSSREKKKDAVNRNYGEQEKTKKEPSYGGGEGYYGDSGRHGKPEGRLELGL